MAKAAKAAEPKTPEEYIDSLEEPRRSEVEELHRFIRNTVPTLQPYIEGYGGSAMIGYGRYHYRYATGREGDWCLVGLAARKAGISLYVMAGDEDGYLAESRAPKLGKVSVGKSCIRIKRLDDVDRGELGKLLQDAVSSAPPGAADA